MLSRSIATVLALSSALGVTRLATAEAGDTTYGAACAAPFGAEGITSVTPYKVTRTNLRRSSTRLEGAVVTVAAQPGLTRECLPRQDHDPVAGSQKGVPDAGHRAPARLNSTGDGFAINGSNPGHHRATQI